MTHLKYAVALVAVALGTLIFAAPEAAYAGSVRDDLRQRGVNKWVDRYVADEKVGQKTTSVKRRNSSSQMVVSSKKLKKSSKFASGKKFGVKRKPYRKLTTAKLKSKKVPVKKTFVSKTSNAKKLAAPSNTKKYKVPQSVKNRLASYGIDF